MKIMLKYHYPKRKEQVYEIYCAKPKGGAVCMAKNSAQYILCHCNYRITIT